MKDRRRDSNEFIPPIIPYDTRLSAPDDTLRQPITGASYSSTKNAYITASGSLAKRPALVSAGANAIANGKIMKQWFYETLPDSAGTIYKYHFVCVYFPATAYYDLYYLNVTSGFSGSYAQVSTTRDLDKSKRVHELVVFNGKVYAKSFTDGTSNTLGTVIIDGSSGSLVIRPWGLTAPTRPVRISFKGITKLNGAMTATGTGTITVDSTTGFDASGTLRIGYEYLTYTTKPTGTTFNGTVTRGTDGTTAEAHGDNEIVMQLDFAASDHQIDVDKGWLYSYAYKSITGQISSRAPVQTNVDLAPSFTGPFRDKIPKMLLEGHADTTNITKIIVYRTKNGGGTFYKLEEITNTGSGDITYYDDSYGTGGSSSTFNDAVPDNVLEGENRQFAPTTVSNGPPVTVEDPQVTGTDYPSRLCFGMEVYAGRIFIAVGRSLFYSSREELIVGLNEESFKLGTGGNFITFSDLIVGLKSTAKGLYVLTTKRLILITGTTRDSFVDTEVSSIGGAIPDMTKGGRVIEAVDDYVVYVSKDNSLITMKDGAPRAISDPVGTALYLTSPGTYVCRDLIHYRDALYDILIWGYNLSESDPASPGAETYAPYWYIYDLKRSEELKQAAMVCNRHLYAGGRIRKFFLARNLRKFGPRSFHLYHKSY
jgi:hypothetical protein